MRLARLIGPELETFLGEHPDKVRELLDEIHPEDVADIIAELGDETAAKLLTELPTEYAALVFQRLDETRQQRVVETIRPEAMVRIAVEMNADDRTDFITNLDPDLVPPILQGIEQVDPEAAEEVSELRRWPENSAGGS